MQKTKLLYLSLAIILLPLLASCQAATPAPIPTNTPYPTSTPYPTYTPYPTLTSSPTPLPTATATATEVPPTATEVPYVPPVEQPTDTQVVHSSSGSAPITWSNETSHVIKIVAAGSSGSYTVTLDKGEKQTIAMAAGDYTVKYYLDGSSSSSGTDNLTVHNEEHLLLTLNFK